MCTLDDDLNGLIGRMSLNDQRVALPLHGVVVEAQVRDFIAEVKISQVYKNTCMASVDATFYFPLDAAASVCKFAAEYMDGTVVDGVVHEKSNAKHHYRSAISAGHQAQLLEAVRPDIFSIKVGNLPENEEIKINITYVAPLRNEGDAVRFVLPTHIGKRYCPNNAAPESAWKDMRGMAIHVKFCMRSKIKTLVSTTHGDEPSWCVTHDPQRPCESVVSLTATELTSDVVILCEEEQPNEPRAVLEIGEGGSMAGVVTLLPHLEFRDAPREFIFLVDRSGSMSDTLQASRQGHGSAKTQMDHAREALLLFLRAMPTSSYFNIIGFGSSFSTLFETSQAYDEVSLAIATQHAQYMSANMGGTELLAPLRHALKTKKKRVPRGMERQIFVLTDGQVCNESKVFDVVARKRSKAESRGMSVRVFSLGIGAAVSHHLVEGLARAGGGTAEFVTSTKDDLGLKVLKQLKLALQPALNNVSVTWNFPLSTDNDNRPPQQPVGNPCSLAAPQVPLPSGVSQSLHSYRSPQVDGVMDFSTDPLRGLLVLPTVAPPVFSKQRFLSWVLFPETDSAQELPESVTVEAQSPDGPLRVTIPISDQNVVRGSTAHKLAARAAIREYEELKGRNNGTSWLQQLAGTQPPCGESRGVTKDMALRLAIRHQLVSSQTSFVAVRRSPSVATGDGHEAAAVSLPHGHANLVGRLIGPRGKNLKKLEAEFAVKLSIRGQRETAEGMHVSIVGDHRDRVDAAAKSIHDSLKRWSEEAEETGDDRERRAQLSGLTSINGTRRADESLLGNEDFELVDAEASEEATSAQRPTQATSSLGLAFLAKKSWHSTPTQRTRWDAAPAPAMLHQDLGPCPDHIRSVIEAENLPRDARVSEGGYRYFGAASGLSGVAELLKESKTSAVKTPAQEWSIPPCVSSWKNAKGYTIPLPSSAGSFKGETECISSWKNVKGYTISLPGCRGETDLGSGERHRDRDRQPWTAQYQYVAGSHLILDPKTRAMRDAPTSTRSRSPSRSTSREPRQDGGGNKARGRSRSRSREREASSPAAYDGEEAHCMTRGADDRMTDAGDGGSELQLPSCWDRNMVVKLLLLQRADGTFPLEGIAQLLGMSTQRLEELAMRKMQLATSQRDALGTLVAIALMRKALGLWNDMWELQAGKAIKAMSALCVDECVDALVRS